MTLNTWSHPTQVARSIRLDPGVSSEFKILGTVEVLLDGDSTDLGSPRQRALLARLLTSPGQLVTADRLVEDLWAEDPPPSARHALHVYVSRLRKALGDDRSRVESRAGGYVLNVAGNELDATRFERLAREGRAARQRGDPGTASSLLNRALGLWRGPALAEFADEPFARDECVRLEQLRLTTLEERVWADLELGRHRQLVEELQELTRQHPFREGFCEQLMLALYRSDRQADALRAFQVTRRYLAEELGVEPGPALRRMEALVLAQDPTLDAEPRVSEHKVRLPVQRTSFVGRERELARSGELLETSRLLTFTGPPGSGKTRLALRLASARRNAFDHGVVFVPLAAIADPSGVTSEIVRVLDIREAPGDSSPDAIAAFFRERRSLLVLDNFEHVLGAASQIGELLDAAPGLTILVTSRAPLGLAGEQEFSVPPLSIPPRTVTPELDALHAYDAVALFVARARATDPEFDLDPRNAAAIAKVIARLDGLPLAIELAAARMKVLTPEGLLRRLERRLPILTRAAAPAVGRQRTMRDAIAWSFDLLEPEDQLLFSKLSVFAGGFTLDAAAEVADMPGSDALERVGSLLTNSLIYRPVAVGEARYAMLETLREFAVETLREAGDETEVADRHAAWFLRLARECEPDLTSDAPVPAIERLSAEINNVRAALRHALDDNPELGLDLASSMWRFWQSANLLTEGKQWLGALLAQPGVAPEARARGLTALGGLAYWQAEYDNALSAYAEALDLYRGEGDRWHEAETLYSMSLTANWKGDLDVGSRHAEAARQLFEEVGTPEDVAKVLMAEAFVVWRRGEIAAARTLWEQSIEVARHSGDAVLANTQLVGLASLAFHQGRQTEALRTVLGAVDEATELHNSHVTVWMLDFIAAFAARSAPLSAVRLAGAVDALRREAGGGIEPGALNIEDARTVATRLLDGPEVDLAWAEGRLMTLEEALVEAHRLEHLVSGV